MQLYRDFNNHTQRPSADNRLFASSVVDETTAHVAAKIADPTLKRLFEQCLPNTLDTTVYTSDAEVAPDTFVVTGDIPAMWLRDSTNQMWPYLRFTKEDPQLNRAFIGLIHRQARCVIRDPYANAFVDTSIAPDIPSTQGPTWGDGIWERKYEVDSLASFFRLSNGYFEASHNTEPFDADWLVAVQRALDVITAEQSALTRQSKDTLFRFLDPNGNAHPALRLEGYGYPGAECGLVRTVFRPSDDEAVFPYNIPANVMLMTQLASLGKLLDHLDRAAIATKVSNLSQSIRRAIHQYGVTKHPHLGRLYAYEVDGFGSVCVMDDPNVPNLLSLPYLGYCDEDDPVYLATRQLALSQLNPFYASGKYAAGLTSPHTGVLNRVWPIAIIMEAMTTSNSSEIITCLEHLRQLHAGTFFMHESVNVDDPASFTRPWFAWANSLFGELILNLADIQPDILSHKYPGV